MSSRITRVLAKVAATGLLAAGFVVLFINVPFISQIDDVVMGRPQVTAITPSLKLPALSMETNFLPPSTLPGLQAPNAAGLLPSMGLFSARFAQGNGSPGFSTAELTVDGDCEGAGRRYIEQTCRDCQVFAGQVQPGQPQALTWSEANGALHSVTADCTGVGADGNAVIAVASLAGGELENSDDSQGIVPLLPGGKRLAALKMGSWLATMDDVSEPETALSQMSAALRENGWREAAEPESGVGVLATEQRVFTRNGQETCVVYLNEAGGMVQLVTIVNS
jgi:hypothetical protein